MMVDNINDTVCPVKKVDFCQSFLNKITFSKRLCFFIKQKITEVSNIKMSVYKQNNNNTST